MKRIDIYITEAQFFFLTKLHGTLSEHIRRAVDAYIATFRQVNVSSSTSKRKDEENGWCHIGYWRAYVDPPA